MAANVFDIIVVGAGIAGASVAARLAEARSVAVLEAESRPGYHSTGRSAALFSEIYGGAQVRALSRGSRQFFYAPPADFVETPLVKRRGSLYIATKAQRAQLERFAALSDVAPATVRLTGPQLIDICPILRPDLITDAVLEPSAADIDVDALHQGYLRELRGHGGLIYNDHPVEALSRQGDRWVVTVRGQQFIAPVVINAAGAWADQVARLAGVSPIGLQPRRRTALLVEPPAGVAIDAWPMVIDIDEQFYFKPDAGLLMLSPADETPVDPCDIQPEELDIAIAVDRVETATTLQVRRVKHSWAGLRSFVADRAPVAGYDPNAPGFFWLAGQGGYGIQTAPALAATAAALVLKQPIPEQLLALGVDPISLSPARLEMVTT